MPDSTLDVGRQLAALCAEGRFVDAIDALYADDIVSVECVAMEGHPREQRGIESVRAKNVWWIENHDVHGVETLGPYPHDDRFVVVFKIDVTSKVGPSAGKRMTIEEAVVYTAKDGKIVHEAFFYDVSTMV